MQEKEIYIKVMADGPYLVYGMPEITEKIIISDEEGVCIDYADGKFFEVKTEPIALCRCGKTENAPFCDGSHNSGDCDIKETATFDNILDGANTYEGPNLILKDNEKYCALARFCDAYGTIWNLIYSGTEEADNFCIKEANLCPSGRLLIFDKEGNLLEDELPKSIAILEDVGLKISGPVWVRGGIRIESASGKSYEVRNRQTLCRCGQSKNKPFCDCTHRHINFIAKKIGEVTF